MSMKLLFQPWQVFKLYFMLKLFYIIFIRLFSSISLLNFTSLTFVLQTVVEPAFWGTLGDWKLEELKLEEGPVPIHGTYTPSNHPQIPGALALSPQSLTLSPPSTSDSTSSEPSTAVPDSSTSPRTSCQVHGQLYCLNTVERVTTFERQAAVAQATSAIWDAICNGQAEQEPSLLQRMIALVYCDLKKYKYFYLLGFPVCSPPAAYCLARPPQTVTAYFGSAQQAQHVTEALWDYLGSLGHGCMPPFFLMELTGSGGSELVTKFHPLTAWADAQTATSAAPSATTSGLEQNGAYLVFADPSNATDYPGWPLRNALLLAAVHWKVPMLRVLCLRTVKGRPHPDASLILEVNLPEIAPGFHPGALGGWDVGLGGKQGPKIADLGAAMDPRRLAASAVALNLQLMRWRAAPTLDLSKVSTTRCLLLGAGTLGCSVARCLLGWGVQKITFVDNARVAYSNPVRQSLFTFDDCLNGGKPKAAAAADAVRAIFPEAEVSGVELSIPMPGHPPASDQIDSFIRDAGVLQELVQAHDVVFMLLDTRESRWLATVMCADAGKLAITSALGFESFVVMRHGGGIPPSASFEEGSREETAKEVEEGSEGKKVDMSVESRGTIKKKDEVKRKKKGVSMRLGCYFCNDVIAPANSTRDRTMDQQCTVARPGLSGIAGSLAVEIMAATLQHPLGINAPPAGHALPNLERSRSEEDMDSPEQEESSEESGLDARDPPLGQVPHMIRGHLSGFSQMCLTGQAFPQCPACSEAVVEQYRQRGAEFVLQAVSQPGYLEELTGLRELQKEMEEAMAAMEIEKEREALERKEGNKEESGSGGEDWEEL